MKTNRIVLALALAGLAGSALADTGAAPVALSAAPAKPTPGVISTEWAFVATALEERIKRTVPTVSEMVATKSTDLASPSLVSSSSQNWIRGGSGNDKIQGGFGNDVMQRGDRIGAAALPQPAGTGGGAGKVGYNGTLVFYLGGMPAPRTALTGAASGRPAETLSLNYTKIEYKYIPYDAKGPAAGAMGMRR